MEKRTNNLSVYYPYRFNLRAQFVPFAFYFPRLKFYSKLGAPSAPGPFLIAVACLSPEISFFEERRIVMRGTWRTTVR